MTCLIPKCKIVRQEKKRTVLSINFERRAVWKASNWNFRIIGNTGSMQKRLRGSWLVSPTEWGENAHRQGPWRNLFLSSWFPLMPVPPLALIQCAFHLGLASSTCACEHPTCLKTQYKFHPFRLPKALEPPPSSLNCGLPTSVSLGIGINFTPHTDTLCWCSRTSETLL